MQRPPTIIAYERVYIASFVTSMLGWVLTWPALSAKLASDPRTAALGWTLPVSLGLSVVFTLLLWHFTARRPVVIAKWIVVVLAAVAAVRLLLNAPALTAGLISPLAYGIAAVTALLSVWASAYLFRREAREWFGEDLEDPIDDNEKAA